MTGLLGFSAGLKYIPITTAYSFLSGKIGQCSPRFPHFRVSESLQTFGMTYRTGISPSRPPRTQENTNTQNARTYNPDRNGWGSNPRCPGMRRKQCTQISLYKDSNYDISLICRPVSFYDDAHASVRLVTAVFPNSLIRNPFRTSPITNEMGNKRTLPPTQFASCIRLYYGQQCSGL
jgi:hypothetical protein